MSTNSVSTIPSWTNAAAGHWRRVLDRVKHISPEVGDALLYGVSALFALGTIYTSTNALYQVWGRMALSPFAFGALASAVLAWMLRRARRRRPGGRLTQVQHRRAWLARIGVAVCVFAGRSPFRSGSRSCGGSTASRAPTSSPRS